MNYYISIANRKTDELVNQLLVVELTSKLKNVARVWQETRRTKLCDHEAYRNLRPLDSRYTFPFEFSITFGHGQLSH